MQDHRHGRVAETCRGRRPACHRPAKLKDVFEGTISHLTPSTTVANMSKLSDQSTREDVAAGLCNMIFQSIGVMAVFAAKRHLTRTILCWSARSRTGRSRSEAWMKSPRCTT
ncbi:MAG: hypothetical protein R2881_00425 [Eubacteriales bacterium]